MPVGNGIPSYSNPATLAAPRRTADIEAANNQRALDQLGENGRSIIKWSTADIALHFAGHALALTMAAIQLAHRKNGLQTSAEKLAVPTALFSAGDLLASPMLGCFGTSMLMNGMPGQAAFIDVLRIVASGFGMVLPGLVLANPAENSAGKAHEVTAAVALGVIGTAILFTTYKWGRAPGFAPAPRNTELQLSAIDGNPDGNRAQVQPGRLTA